jgi:hypothetical protein
MDFLRNLIREVLCEHFDEDKAVVNDEYRVELFDERNGYVIVGDRDKNLYLVAIDDIDKTLVEPYADIEIRYLGKDEDGDPVTEYGEWKVDEHNLSAYLNDNSKYLKKGVGLNDYESGGYDIVLVDDSIKNELLSLNKNKEIISDILSRYNKNINEDWKPDFSDREQEKLRSSFVDEEIPIDEKIRMEIDPDLGIVPSTELANIAIEYGYEPESDDFIKIYTNIINDIATEKDKDLLSDMDYVSKENLNDSYPDDFNEFYDVFKQYNYDHNYSREQVRDMFKKLTTDPDQLKLFEGVRDKVAFRKVSFNTDISKISSDDRIYLMNLIKKFHGEKLSTDSHGVWHTFVPASDLKKFMVYVNKFQPELGDSVRQLSKFKTRIKALKDGDKIKFYDYEVSETEPEIVTGYLKPGFVGVNKSLLKYPGGEMWIKNDNVDANFFYHRDEGDIIPKNIKVFFLADFSELDVTDKKELLDIVKKHGGITRSLSGAGLTSGGREYAIIPEKNIEDFYIDAERFEPYDAEMEKDTISEVRKIVRKIMLEHFKK